MQTLWYILFLASWAFLMFGIVLGMLVQYGFTLRRIRLFTPILIRMVRCMGLFGHITSVGWILIIWSGLFQLPIWPVRLISFLDDFFVILEDMPGPKMPDGSTFDSDRIPRSLLFHRYITILILSNFLGSATQRVLVGFHSNRSVSPHSHLGFRDEYLSSEISLENEPISPSIIPPKLLSIAYHFRILSCLWNERLRKWNEDTLVSIHLSIIRL